MAKVPGSARALPHDPGRACMPGQDRPGNRRCVLIIGAEPRWPALAQGYTRMLLMTLFMPVTRGFVGCQPPDRGPPSRQNVRIPTACEP